MRVKQENNTGKSKIKSILNFFARFILIFLISLVILFILFILNKSIWDLLELAIIPISLTGIAAWFNHNERKKSEDAKIRDRAALIGELLAEWISLPDEQARLNKLTFEAFLWLPDHIARDLSPLLANKDGAISIRDLLLKVRKHLQRSNDKLTANEIIIFTDEHEKKKMSRQEQDI